MHVGRWGLAAIVIAIASWLILSYTLLARKEEPRMLAKFGSEYRAYQRRVPMFIPRSMSGLLPQKRDISAEAITIICDVTLLALSAPALVARSDSQLTTGAF